MFTVSIVATIITVVFGTISIFAVRRNGFWYREFVKTHNSLVGKSTVFATASRVIHGHTSVEDDIADYDDECYD